MISLKTTRHKSPFISFADPGPTGFTNRVINHGLNTLNINITSQYSSDGQGNYGWYVPVYITSGGEPRGWNAPDATMELGTITIQMYRPRVFGIGTHHTQFTITSLDN